MPVSKTKTPVLGLVLGGQAGPSRGWKRGPGVLPEGGPVQDLGSGAQGTQPRWPALGHCLVCLAQVGVLTGGSRWLLGMSA